MNLSSRALLLGLLAACGGGDDGPPNVEPDARIDEVVDAPLPARTTVHVLDGAGAPVAGRAVAFLAADDAVVAEVTTDATGAASAEMGAGGSVTVAAAAVVQAGTTPLMFTYLNVRDGDDLVIGEPPRPATQTFGVTLTVPASAAPTAQGFSFNATCNVNASNSTSARSVDMNLRQGCTTTDFYVEAQDSGLRMISALWLPAQPVTAGATISMGAQFVAPVTSMLSVKNVPSGTVITPSLDLVVGDFYPVPVLFTSELALTGGAGTRLLKHATIPGASLETRVLIEGVGGRSLWVTRTAAPQNATLDFATAPRVTVDDAAYFPGPSAVGWSQTGPATDISMARLQVVNGTARKFQWVIVGPTSGSVRVPHLPGSLGAFNIAADDTVSVVEVAAGTFPGGYDRVRPLVFHRASAFEGLAFFSPFQGADRRNRLAHVLANGDTAMIATGR